MTADPRGRWFQLSLRTMFACVTVAAIGLAELVYGLKWIGERHAYTDNLGSHGYIVVGSDEGSAPGLLWLFGERGFDQLRTGRRITSAFVHNQRQIAGAV
jgi:hypothetical protein